MLCCQKCIRHIGVTIKYSSPPCSTRLIPNLLYHPSSFQNLVYTGQVVFWLAEVKLRCSSNPFQNQVVWKVCLASKVRDWLCLKSSSKDDVPLSLLSSTPLYWSNPNNPSDSLLKWKLPCTIMLLLHGSSLAPLLTFPCIFNWTYFPSLPLNPLLPAVHKTVLSLGGAQQMK